MSQDWYSFYVYLRVVTREVDGCERFPFWREIHLFMLFLIDILVTLTTFFRIFEAILMSFLA